MIINKLKDLYKNKPEYGASLPALRTGKYKYVRQTDLKNKFFPTFVNSGPLLKKNDILISRTGANAGETYIHDSYQECVFAGFLVRYNFDDSKLNNKYFYYWTKTNKYKNQLKKLIEGSGQPQFNPSTVSELNIFIPTIELQQKIIDIIEQNETLFLKYSNCIRIDTLENVQTDMKNLIEIVKPFELYENKILNIIKFIEKSFFFRSFEINNFIKENINWKSAGYTYKYSDKNLHGVYKIFTVKNINNKFKFEKTNITKNNLINIGDVITGLSGTIGTASIVYENNWVSNQRTLVLRSNIPLNIKIAIIKQNNFLIKHATGAVQKNITIDDILNLKMIKKTANDEYINEFYIKFLILKNKIKEIKKSIINLLIK
ncbi:hypothetical protein LT335_00466 [Spiroplasma sp. JKS002669]|uniref:restriction endonuclease subunit S n=1 Tax=Spiroplasma attinicola TaxID=2904537 RepID=UPI0020BECBD0|nr:restriction endonuclease subunit S [Spiroplasma sp. JKS002669]MCL6428918.1 hypothetical protein [Spiroplasma sp. JKS002669]